MSNSRGASCKLFHNKQCYRDLLPIERYMCSLAANQKFYDTALPGKDLAVLDSELEELTAITKLFHSLEDEKFRSLLSDAQVEQTKQDVKS